MKRLIAIALLTFHLFSTGGYMALYQYLSYRSEVFFNEQTSKNRYNIADLVEVKIPADMPNIADWPAYQRASGTVKFEDASYNYVKIKITRTAIYLMCIPNYETTVFSTANVLVVKGIKDIPVPKKDHVPFLKLNLTEKANFDFDQFAFDMPVRNIHTTISQPAANLLFNTRRVPEQPPQAIC